jgi:hypothetical protein
MFDVKKPLTTTNGAYDAGDVIDTLFEIDVGAFVDRGKILQRVSVTLKAAITPQLVLSLFDADPSGSGKTNNAAYGVVAADIFKLIKALDFTAMGAQMVDHGTPNSYELENLAIPFKPAAGTHIIYGLLWTKTGVTMTSTSDAQVRVAGIDAGP